MRTRTFTLSLAALIACGDATDEPSPGEDGGITTETPHTDGPGASSGGSNEGVPKVTCPAGSQAWSEPSAPAAAPFVFQVVGDVHAHASDPRAQVNIGRAMDDLKAIGPTRQLLVVNGDLTERGNASEYEDLRRATAGKLPANTMWLIGNHDYHGPDSSTVEKSRYTAFAGVPNVFHERQVGGYTFIALGGENGEGDPGKLAWTAVLSDAQLAWLDDRLTIAARGDKPVFVFLHQGPWDATNEVRLNRTLGAHPNVIFFWSHYHRDLHAPKAPQAFQDADNYWKVHTGAVQYNWDSADGMHYDWAQGLQVEVGADKVLVRGRDFTARQWITQFQHPIVREDNADTNGAAVDFDGDGLADVLGTHANGKLAFHGVAGRFELAGPSGSLLETLVDADGDGKPDLVTTTADGVQHVFLNTSVPCKPSLGAKMDIGTGWQSVVRISSADIDGDGKFDLLATRNDGHLVVYLGTGAPGKPSFSEGKDLGTGFLGAVRLRTLDADGDGKVDLFTQTSDGKVAIHRNESTKGTPKLAPKTELPISFSAYDRVLVVDADKDGKQDLLVRRSDGVLLVLPNTGTAGKPGFGAAVEVGKGWQDVTRTLVVDGDLVGRTKDGKLVRYPRMGKAWGEATPAGAGWQDVLRIVVP